jgi:hypothetical protein
VGFLGEFVSVIGKLECLFRTPAPRFLVPLFIMFGGNTMGVGRKFVLLGGSPVEVVLVGVGHESSSASLSTPANLYLRPGIDLILTSV